MTFENNGLAGEVSLGGTAKTGDAESTDLGIGVKLRHETPLWRNIFGGNYDWGSAEGTDTKNRLATTYELARLLNDRLYGFGRAAYETDAFSGYEYRSVLGGGLGYDVMRGEHRNWSLQGGPAYRVDEVEPSFDDQGVLLAPAETQTAAALNLGSRFEAQLNDAVSFRNDTDFTSSVDTSTILNSSALTAEIMGAVAARFSFDVMHDTSAPLGTEKTDTITRATLVYAFGGN
jgi:putative salt-induced outer membrane protein